MKYSFMNDYSIIGHPKVLKKLLECSMEQNVGYGLDVHTNNAKKLIQKHIEKPVDIYFLTGGTQANLVVISHMLKNYQAVISVETGHINVHEAGAIEGCGHKILTVKGENGKILPYEIEEIVKMHPDMHMVQPKLVYISNTTEVGSVYSRKELIEISKMCKKHNLYLFLDGARLASGLAASDMTLNDIANYCDAFYIGGTKNGLPYGEAVVIANPTLVDGFDYHIKNKGALLAKGFACSIGFEALFENGLYFEIGRSENESALFLASGLEKLGFSFSNYPQSNQVFVKMKKSLTESIKNDYLFEVFSEEDDMYVVRLVTAFDTKIEDCKEFLSYLELRI